MSIPLKTQQKKKSYLKIKERTELLKIGDQNQMSYDWKVIYSKSISKNQQTSQRIIN